jgi:hypothetical protein
MSSLVSPRKAACDHVYSAYPDMKGARPSVREAGGNRVFVFEKTLSEKNGPALRQVVKVTVDSGGRVLKVVASR